MEALRNWQPPVRGGTPASPESMEAESPPMQQGSGCLTSCMLVACLASCAAGTTLGYASTAAQSIEVQPWYTLERRSPDNRWFADMLLLVAAPSALTTGLLLDTVGNRMTLLLASFGLLASWITLLFCSNTVSLFVARIMSGIFLGALSSCVGMHVADICPSRRRAFFLGLVEVTRNAGILMAYVLGYCCSWEVQAGLCVLPPLLIMCLQNRVLNSPQWLMRNGRLRDATHALYRLYGTNVPPEFTVRAARDIKNTWDSMPAYTSARRLALGVLVQLVPCLSCVQLLLLRAVQVMEALVADKKAAKLAALWMLGGHVVLSAGFASVTWLAGRRHLLLLSAVMTAMCVAVLRPLDHLAFSVWSLEESPGETNWSGVRAVGLLLASYSIGLCHVPALLVAELLPGRVRTVGVAGAWTGRWLLAFLFVHLDGWVLTAARYSGSLPFCAVLLAAAVAVFALVPETEGRTLVAIQKEL
ncbi:solute carrier family 2, facilitated glucose transporter member 8 [Dermacentor silvarum]|uniref:solute carrier family 2, facilitated glucose transporter member 8 n=1 Tax=Dermacentor silvarum TaxID=543639 RepID=UPI002100A631|nr:solute carrier family 2, facilitated glucose transporter member 8 [Dermacentor silvarum]